MFSYQFTNIHTYKQLKIYIILISLRFRVKLEKNCKLKNVAIILKRPTQINDVNPLCFCINYLLSRVKFTLTKLIV